MSIDVTNDTLSPESMECKLRHNIVRCAIRVGIPPRVYLSARCWGACPPQPNSYLEGMPTGPGTTSPGHMGPWAGASQAAHLQEAAHRPVFCGGSFSSRV